MTERQIESEVKICASVNESDNILSSWIYICVFTFLQSVIIKHLLYTLHFTIVKAFYKNLLLCFHVTRLGSVLLKSDVLNE